MKFILPYDLLDAARLLDFSEMAKPPEIVALTDSFELSVDDSDIQEMQIIMTEELVAKGLEDQNVVNETGKKLYALYDEILSQIKQ
ncbi:MAG: hypothetical protein GXW96_12790 [Christensenellaceae bacterium]|nr:hypothetical protein [Christensenellaceae bacterium]